MRPGILIAKETDDRAGTTHNMLGLSALVAEMAEQGISAEALLQGTGLQARQLDDPQARITPQQKLTIFRNTKRLNSLPEAGLRAGARQRLSDFGVYGYAVVSSRTFGEAVMLGIKHVRLAGPVLEKRFRIDGATAVFEAHDTLDLGDVLTALLASDGVPVANRSHLGKLYPNCWIGSEAIDHLVGRHRLQRHDAWLLLHRLMQFGLIEHVTNSRPVIDGNFFYRFTGQPVDGNEP